MIQDIAPLRLRNAYKRKEPDKKSRVIGFCGQKIFLRIVPHSAEGQITYLTYRELEENCRERQVQTPFCRYLFSMEDAGEETDYFLADLTGAEEFGAYEFCEMYALRAMKPKELVFAGTTAYHLFTWYRDNRFCGRCGEVFVHEEEMRALRCPSCGNIAFPKIAPAVIVAVTNGEYLLLTKYAGRAYKRYALIAGFTEIGETAEETVAREVMEETGVRVRNIRYYKSQPWGFDSNLLLGYFCELDGDSRITMDTEELSTAEWVHYSDVPEDFEELSLTREMMTVFRESFQGKGTDRRSE